MKNLVPRNVATAVLLVFSLIFSATICMARPMRKRLKLRTNKTLPVFRGGRFKAIKMNKRVRPSFMARSKSLSLVKASKLGKSVNFIKNYSLTPAIPRVGPAFLGYTKPAYVTAGPYPVAGFESQEGLSVPGANSMAVINFKPPIKARYLVEISVSGGSQYRVYGAGGQEATFGANSQPVLVFDGTTVPYLDIKIIGKTDNSALKWHFNGCKISRIQ